MEAQPGPHTPGVAGYALAVLVSVVVVVVAIGVLEGGEPTLAADLRTGLGLVGLVGALGLPFAVPGVLVVHLCCRRVPEQWVHVVAAGFAGLVAGLVLDVLAVWAEAPLVLATATAVGRWSVVPLVLRRRRVQERREILARMESDS